MQEQDDMSRSLVSDLELHTLNDQTDPRPVIAHFDEMTATVCLSSKASTVK